MLSLGHHKIVAYIGERLMLKNITKKLLLQSIDLPKQKRIAVALLHNIVWTSSRQDIRLLESVFASVDVAKVLLEDRIRQFELSGRTVPDPLTPGCRTPLQTWVREDQAPWKRLPIDPVPVPGMISDEETQYYDYIGTLYEGHGGVIELGPWLGKSTRHIIRGLDKNPQFAGKRLHVFDDFVWRPSWMDQYTPEHERLPNHADFRPLFEKYAQDLLPRLNVTRGRISDYDGNEALPRIRWDLGPIEMMYIDCGRTVQANEGWFEIFSPSFIPDVTLLIMQDWGVHRERPRLSYNQTLWFTEAHPELDLVHEVKIGAIAAFLYRGAQST
jgi:hypothetical protein